MKYCAHIHNTTLCFITIEIMQSFDQAIAQLLEIRQHFFCILNFPFDPNQIKLLIYVGVVRECKKLVDIASPL